MVTGENYDHVSAKGEAGGAKAQMRTVSMLSLVLGSPLAVFRTFASETQLAGHPTAQAHCLRSGGLALSSPSQMNELG